MGGQWSEHQRGNGYLAQSLPQCRRGSSREMAIPIRVIVSVILRVAWSAVRQVLRPRKTCNALGDTMTLTQLLNAILCAQRKQLRFRSCWVISLKTLLLIDRSLLMLS